MHGQPGGPSCLAVGQHGVSTVSTASSWVSTVSTVGRRSAASGLHDLSVQPPCNLHGCTVTVRSTLFNPFWYWSSIAQCSVRGEWSAELLNSLPSSSFPLLPQILFGPSALLTAYWFCIGEY